MQKLWREPLFHFLFIGGGLFLLYNFLNPKEVQLTNNEIRLEDSDIERLIKAYRQNWNTPPNHNTLQKLVNEEIKSEVFYREALRMQLDHNDEIIRRRLKQKYEFLVKDLASSQQPSSEELQTFYQSNPDLYKAPTTISFYQIYFSPDKRNNSMKTAEQLWETIKDKEPTALSFKQLGDSFHLQHYFSDRDFNDVRQLFGQAFTQSLFEISTTGWIPPIASGYGVHLVYISSITKEKIKPYEEVESKALEDWKIAQQKKYNEQLYQNLLRQYEVHYNLEKWSKQ